MTKLLSNYARTCGLKIGDHHLREDFYPLPFSRYITLQSGSGQGAKNYDYIPDVMQLVQPMLAANGIQVVLLGGKDDPAVMGTFDLRGKTTHHQSHYVLNRALAHWGSDSWLAHVAGWRRKPIVECFGSTSQEVHSPYFYDSEKTIFLSSHRGGGRPTYASNEQPKTINLIPPEQIANALLRALGINHVFTRQTQFIGHLYQVVLFDLIPSTHPTADFMPGAIITVRMDKMHLAESALADANLLNLLQTGRKVNIVTNRPVDLAALSPYRANILFYNHDLTADTLTTPQYARAAKATFPRTLWFSREQDAQTLAERRFTFFDTCVIEQIRDQTKEDYEKGRALYLNAPPEENVTSAKQNVIDTSSQSSHTRFKSNRFVLCNGSIYTSYAHVAANKPISSLAENTCDVIDDPLFHADLQHYLVYTEPS